MPREILELELNRLLRDVSNAPGCRDEALDLGGKGAEPHRRDSHQLPANIDRASKQIKIRQGYRLNPNLELSAQKDRRSGVTNNRADDDRDEDDAYEPRDFYVGGLVVQRAVDLDARQFFPTSFYIFSGVSFLWVNSAVHRNRTQAQGCLLSWCPLGRVGLNGAMVV